MSSSRASQQATAIRVSMPAGVDERSPIFVISVAAELAGMHPQTLRQYDRLGLVTPSRTAGRGRRYSLRDVQRLREIQRLSLDEGVNLAGIKKILDLHDELAEVRTELDRAERELAALAQRQTRVFTADPDGRISPLRRGERPQRRGGALVLWKPADR